MSTTVQLGKDGHTATLRDPADMTVGQRRPLQVLVSAFGESRFRELIMAQNGDGPKPVTDQEKEVAARRAEAAVAAMNLTEQDWDLLLRTTNATVYGLLESWTLPDPIPATVAEVDNIPGWAMDAITAEAISVQAEHMASMDMTVDAVEDPTSPTGASALSAISSTPAEAALQPFPGTPGSSSTSTGTAPLSVV